MTTPAAPSLAITDAERAEAARWAKPRALRQYRGSNTYPVTVGGYDVGEVRRADNATWSAYAVATGPATGPLRVLDHGFPTRQAAAEALARDDEGVAAYREAAADGAFGTAAERAERERRERVDAELAEADEAPEADQAPASAVRPLAVAERDTVDEAEIEAPAPARVHTAEVVPSRYRDDVDQWVTPDFTDAVTKIRMRSRHQGPRECTWSVLYIGPEGSARRVHGGPKLPGPYAALIPEATVIADSAQPGDRAATETLVAGDYVAVRGHLFRITDDRPGYNPALELVTR